MATIITHYPSRAGEHHGFEILGKHYPMEFFWNSTPREVLGAIILESGEAFNKLTEKEITILKRNIGEACWGYETRGVEI